MTNKQLVAWRRALERLRDETLRGGPARIEPNRTDGATVGVADEDAQALSEMMQALASQRNRQQAQLVGQIDRALAKLDATPDEFGSCEGCEEPIVEARLKVMPYAALCAECQTKADPRRGEARKKITDYR